MTQAVGVGGLHAQGQVRGTQGDGERLQCSFSQARDSICSPCVIREGENDRNLRSHPHRSLNPPTMAQG